jgi:cell division protein FtsX
MNREKALKELVEASDNYTKATDSFRKTIRAEIHDEQEKLSKAKKITKEQRVKTLEMIQNQ